MSNVVPETQLAETLSIAIVDAPETHHGQLMERYARFGECTPRIQWIRPSLHLPQDLARLDGVVAAAVPLAIHGATAQDRFTSWVIDAIRQAMARQITVFVAAGNRRPNLLAQAGIAVSISDIPGSTSTSEACVRAAAQAACQSLRHGKTLKPFQSPNLWLGYGAVKSPGRRDPARLPGRQSKGINRVSRVQSRRI